MAEYASSSVGTAGLATGIIGTVLGAGASGILPGLLGGGMNQGQYVNKETFDLSLQLAASQRDTAILTAELASEKKMVEVFNASNEKINNVRDELLGKIGAVEGKVDAGFASQAVLNAKASSAITLLQSQVGQLFTMTQLFIPSQFVTPEPMPAKNSWVAPT